MVGQLPPRRPVTDDDRDDLLIPLVSGVQELLFAPVSPFSDRPAFVAGPPPETGLAQAVQAVTQLNCRLWASRDKSGYSPRVNQYNGEVCGPYLDSIGENPTAGFVSPLFRGGQCYGVNYSFDFTFLNNQGSRQTLAQQTTGRLVGTYAVDVDGQDSWNFGFERQAVPGGPVVRVSQGTTFGRGNPDPVITNVAVVGGGGDDCGNPPTVVQPPATVTPVTPIEPRFTVNLPGVGPITVNVDLDDKGRPVICAPDVDTCISINPQFGIGIGGGDDGTDPPGGPTGPAPGDDGEPGAGQTAGNGQDAQGEAPPGSVLVGLKMNMTTIPPNANQYAPGAYRGAAYIYMGGNAGLDQDFAGSVLAQGQFVYAEKDNLTRWRVRANNDFVFNVVPYYRSVE